MILSEFDKEAHRNERDDDPPGSSDCDGVVQECVEDRTEPYRVPAPPVAEVRSCRAARCEGKAWRNIGSFRLTDFFHPATPWPRPENSTSDLAQLRSTGQRPTIPEVETVLRARHPAGRSSGRPDPKRRR